MPPKRKSPAEIADSVRLGVRSASAFDEAAAAETLTLEEEISRWAARVIVFMTQGCLLLVLCLSL
jgi:hypothetical protein